MVISIPSVNPALKFVNEKIEMESEQTIKKIPKLCFVIVNKLWISHNIFIFGNKIIDFFSKDDRRHEIEF